MFHETRSGKYVLENGFLLNLDEGYLITLSDDTPCTSGKSLLQMTFTIPISPNLTKSPQ
jgi:hypothetical protein